MLALFPTIDASTWFTAVSGWASPMFDNLWPVAAVFGGIIVGSLFIFGLIRVIGDVLYVRNRWESQGKGRNEGFWEYAVYDKGYYQSRPAYWLAKWTTRNRNKFDY